MDDELKHILHAIDDMIEAISRTMGHINKMDYTKFGVYHELDHWLYQVYKLNSYTRALDYKLNESCKEVIQSIDNGDME